MEQSATSHPAKPSLCVGRIIAAHGIRGEVKLLSFTAIPGAIATLGTLYTDEGAGFKILKLQAQKNGFIARLENITNRNQAEGLKGIYLYANRAQLPALAENEIYIHDLIGAKIILADGTDFGTLIAMPNYGAGDLLEIERPSAADTILVPFAQNFVPQTDFSSHIITLHLPEGYLDSDDRLEEDPLDKSPPPKAGKRDDV